MATKITDDMIKSQWLKQNEAHKAQWQAIAHIADEMGLQFDEKGNVVGRRQKAQPAVPPEPATPPAPSLSKEDLAQIVADAIKANPPKVVCQQPQPQAQQPAKNISYDNIVQELTVKLSPVVTGYCDSIREAYAAVLDAKATPILEERFVRKMQQFHAYVAKCLRWFYHDLLSSLRKAAAYNIAFCCALFGGVQYYRNQQLQLQSKKDAIVRYVLSGDPSNKAMISRIDSLVASKGVDEVYKR